MTNADVIREKLSDHGSIRAVKDFSDEVVAALIQREHLGCHDRGRWCISCDNADSCQSERDEILEYLKQEVKADD